MWVKKRYSTLCINCEPKTNLKQLGKTLNDHNAASKTNPKDNDPTPKNGVSQLLTDCMISYRQNYLLFGEPTFMTKHFDYLILHSR